MVSLLAAVDALSHIGGFDNLTKQVVHEILLKKAYHTLLSTDIQDTFCVLQLVFAVFTGEAWGFLGSRRFLAELDKQSDAVRDLNFTMIERVHHYWHDNIYKLLCP